MVYISKRNRRLERERYNACRNRREIIEAQLSRREMMRMGLLTSAGLLVAKNGLSVRAQDPVVVPVGDEANASGQTGQCVSPFTEPFVDDFVRMTVKQPETQPLSPTPTIAPNNAAGEGRTRNHQAVTPFPPTKQYRVVQQEAQVMIHRDLDPITIWGFDGTAPGPLYHAFYGEPILVRNVNQLPFPPFADGFGNREVTTHLHNGHTPSESDGFPCDYFPNPQVPAIANAFFYDHY